ncbi:MAG: DUF2029 domain-containing protein [Desulfurococcales archaeon]|nr:DUF2029 domain-containing protein [Desulfurococcales archaeon]
MAPGLSERAGLRLIARPLALLAIVAFFSIRIVVAPYSAGSDIAQFRGFAESFEARVFCMYIYSERQDNWPYSWLYVYPPIMGLLLSGLANYVDSGVDFYWEEGTYRVVVDRGWVVSLKSIYIAADAMLVAVLYKYWGLLPALAYAAMPAAIYNSSIYGMFDHLALLPLLASMVLALRGRFAASGLLMGLSVSIKQTMLLPVLFLVLALSTRVGLAHVATIMASFLFLVSATLSPFLLLCPAASAEISSFLEYMSRIYYPEPIVYSFNGLSSIASYLHRFYGADSIILVRAWPLLFAFFSALSVMTIIRLWRDPDTGRFLVKSAALGYMSFTATYWRVNYQYLIPLAVLSLVAALKSKGLPRMAWLALALTINVWPILYPVSFWFRVHVEPDPLGLSISRYLSIGILDTWAYVVYGCLLTGIQYLVLLIEYRASRTVNARVD